jgi:light-independent protochlorophyllide reductase subunit B
MVIAPPTHIENHLLAYRPFLGFDGADTIADEVYTTCTLGMEKHLIDLFGDAGLEEEAPAAPSTESKGLSTEDDQAALSPQHSALSTQHSVLTWSPDAETMLKKVPFFVRGRVKNNVEKYARERGINTISAEVLLDAKEAIGA